MSAERTFPWRTLLFVSAAFNLLIAGAAIGAYSAGVRVERRAPEAVVDRLPGPRAFVASLPEDVRQDVRADLVESWTQSRDLRRTAAQARREAFQTAATEPYNVERVRAAFARMRAADQAALAIYHDNMAQVFGQMTPEQRRNALAALARAAPARRQTVAPGEAAPADGSAPGAASPPDGAPRERLQERRQLRRERMREWRERNGNP
jgi:uncharacterized membrane protein